MYLHIYVVLNLYRSQSVVTGKAPAELIMGGRQLRSHLDLAKPCLKERIQARKKFMTHTREVTPRGRVYTKNYRRAGLKWLPGKIV